MKGLNPEVAKVLQAIEGKKKTAQMDDDELANINDIEYTNSQLWSVIVNTVEGDALKRVSLVKGENAFEAWRALKDRYNPVTVETGTRNYQQLLAIKEGTMDRLQERSDEMERIAQGHLRNRGREIDLDLMKGKLLNMCKEL